MLNLLHMGFQDPFLFKNMSKFIPIPLFETRFKLFMLNLEGMHAISTLDLYFLPIAFVFWKKIMLLKLEAFKSKMSIMRSHFKVYFQMDWPMVWVDDWRMVSSTKISLSKKYSDTINWFNLLATWCLPSLWLFQL